MALAMVSTVSTARGTAGSPRLSRRALTTKSASDFRSITWSASSRDSLIRGTRRVMTSVFVSRDVVLRRSTRTRGRDARRPSGTRNVTPMASKSFDPSTSYIEGLTPLSEICDDFVCKSSPAVEGSLRQIATDICAVRESKRSQEPYAPDVAFDDGSRRFVGFDGFATHTFIKDTIGNPKCAVTKMKMDANDSATLEWRLVGTGPTGSSVEINVVATLRMNLITGRVIAHTEVWDFGKVDGIAGALLQVRIGAFTKSRHTVSHTILTLFVDNRRRRGTRSRRPRI